MAGFGKRIKTRVHGRAICATWCRAAIQLDAHEETVVAICGDGTEWLAIYWHNADTVLSGALGNELLRPCAEAINRFVDDECHLVAALARQRTHDAAECERMIPRWLGIAALRNCSASRCEKWIKVDAKQRRWHEANKAECGVAPADVGRVQEEATRVDHLRNAVNTGRRIADRGEVCGWLLCGPRGA